MKEAKFQIVQMLEAFKFEDIKEAYKIIAKTRILGAKNMLFKSLRERGWQIWPHKHPPTDREYFFIRGKYWVQDPKAHAQLVKEFFEKKGVPYSGNQGCKNCDQSQGLSRVSRPISYDPIKTELKCPVCGGALYKKLVCPNCPEGRQGYRVRLMCGENSDHMFLV